MFNPGTLLGYPKYPQRRVRPQGSGCLLITAFSDACASECPAWLFGFRPCPPGELLSRMPLTPSSRDPNVTELTASTSQLVLKACWNPEPLPRCDSGGLSRVYTCVITECGPGGCHDSLYVRLDPLTGLRQGGWDPQLWDGRGR